MLKKITKTIVPRSFVEFVLRNFTNYQIKRERKVSPPLIIRENTSDHNVFRSVFVFNEFDLKLSFEPKLIVDLGAYTGISALYLSKKFPTSEIIAVEPEASNFSLLEKNTANIPRIKRINAGVWNKSCILRVTNEKSSKWAFSFSEVENKIEGDVEAVTITEIIDQSEYDFIDILKIDIEGAEIQLFSKNTEPWINRVNVIIIELHDRNVPDCTKTVLGAIDDEIWNRSVSGEKMVLSRKTKLTSNN